jgi:predicted methyltransferase
MKKVALLAAALLLNGCTTPANTAALDQPGISAKDKARLVEVSQSLPAEHQARYAARHPVETLAFFGVKPGDTVIEALPGEGWYSKILVPYLGKNGHLIGVDYSLEMWPEFGPWGSSAEFIESRKAWPAKWSGDAKGWGGNDGASAAAYTFADLPADLTGKVDAVLFIRALHNLARFDAKGQYLQKALAETHRVLKPGGVVGVVQHAMAEDKPDAWTTGERGYLKRSAIIEIMTKAGFEFVAENDINKNPKDDPQDGDNVWRLPPSLNGTDEQKAKNAQIGESNRVTLLFKKR